MHLLEVEGVSKQFGSFWANKDINFVLNEGEIISLLGENGAGKTTLMNILYGLYQPTKGSIRIKGESVHFANPREALNLGLSMVHQHFMLVDNLTVMENIIIGSEPVKKGLIDESKAKEKVKLLSERFGLEVNPEKEVGKLSVGEKQRVELLKALYNDCDILILDEPTAVLTPQEVDSFFLILKALRDNGKGIILISHKLKETMAIADRIYIMRQGTIVGETTPLSSSVERLAELMVGHSLDNHIEKACVNSNKLLLSFNHVSLDRNGKMAIDDMSFNLFSGEILGIAGVDGNGQSEIVELLVGITFPSSGTIDYKGEDISTKKTKWRIEHGLGYIQEDRQKKGQVGAFPLDYNAILGYQNDKRFSHYGILNWRKIDSYTDSIIDKYDVRCRTRKDSAASLSGGNQQKLIIGRVMEADPEVIIASQPTRGVDIGAVEHIHQNLVKMRNEGKAILLLSADLDEVMKLSDTIVVVYDGRIVSCAKNGTYTKTQLGAFMTGGSV